MFFRIFLGMGLYFVINTAPAGQYGADPSRRHSYTTASCRRLTQFLQPQPGTVAAAVKTSRSLFPPRASPPVRLEATLAAPRTQPRQSSRVFDTP